MATFLNRCLVEKNTSLPKLYFRISSERGTPVKDLWQIELGEPGIRAFQWTNYKWNAEYCENTSRLPVFIPTTSAKPVGVSLPRTAWIKLNRLQTGVGRFYFSIHK